MVHLATIITVVASIAAANAWNFDAWSGTDFNATHFHTDKAGKFDLDFWGKSYKFDMKPEECCVMLCANLKHNNLLICRPLDQSGLPPYGWFHKVVIACDDDKPKAVCGKCVVHVVMVMY
jgi:hypothetical protein